MAIMLNIEKFSFNPFRESTLVLWDKTGEGIIIDPGCYDSDEIQDLNHFIVSNDIVIKEIWLTHGHFDHIYGVAELAEHYDVKVRMNDADKVLLENDAMFAKSFGMKAPNVNFQTINVEEGEKLHFGETEFEVILTPGHTPGGVCYYDKEDKVLISGDTLFAGAIGRTDNDWGDYDKLIVSVMDKVMGIDGDVKVYPGHGPNTDISFERTHNPFLQPFNEPIEEMNWDEDGLDING